MSSIDRFLGDSPFRVFLKLLILSFIVGMVMAAFDWTPWDIYAALRDFALRIWYTGFDALGRFGDYLILGAAIVIPAFILIRLFSLRR